MYSTTVALAANTIIPVQVEPGSDRVRVVNPTYFDVALVFVPNAPPSVTAASVFGRGVETVAHGDRANITIPLDNYHSGFDGNFYLYAIPSAGLASTGTISQPVTLYISSYLPTQPITDGHSSPLNVDASSQQRVIAVPTAMPAWHSGQIPLAANFIGAAFQTTLYSLPAGTWPANTAFYLQAFQLASSATQVGVNGEIWQYNGGGTVISTYAFACAWLNPSSPALPGSPSLPNVSFTPQPTTTRIDFVLNVTYCPAATTLFHNTAAMIDALSNQTIPPIGQGAFTNQTARF